MKNAILAMLVACLLLCAGPGRAQRVPDDALRHDMAIARGRVYPALVNIAVVVRYFSEGRAQRSVAGGSGVIITPDGYVVTNFHVAGHTTHVTCTLTTGETLDASVVADDPLSDLSVLKLHLDRRRNPKAPLPYAALGNSDNLKVGDFVLAVGNPLMLSSSMTMGIVSNVKRVFTDFNGTALEDFELEEGEQTGIYTRWIQHDALILPGNSGGPLVNLQGQVVGINELGGNGIGFAIPSNIVSQVFSEVRHYGRVRRGWIGFSPLPVHKLHRATGALVAAVLPDSPASRAGLQAGDILLSLDGAPTNVEFFEQVPVLRQQEARLIPGHVARLKVLRGSAVKELNVLVAPMERYLGDEEEWRDFGLTGREMTRMMALKHNLTVREGVLVTGVRPGFPCDAAQPRLAEGDVIRTVDGKPVADIAAMNRAVAASKSKHEVVVGISRNDESRVTVLKLNPSKAPEEGGELPHAWLGIRAQVMTPDVATAVHLPGCRGFRITQVFPYTEASRAGLKTGDVVVGLNGSDLESSRPQDEDDLRRAIEDLTVGESAELSLLRGGKKIDVKVKLQATPASGEQAPVERQKELEFAVRRLALLDRVEHHWSDRQEGVFVTEVTMGGWANIAGLHVNDLIVSINDQPVPDTSAFKKVMQAVVTHRPRVVRLFVRRGYLTHFVFIEPDWAHLGS